MVGTPAAFLQPAGGFGLPARVSGREKQTRGIRDGMVKDRAATGPGGRLQHCCRVTGLHVK